MLRNENNGLMRLRLPIIRMITLALLILASMLVSPFMASAHRSDSTNGHIQGQLLDGTKNKAPLAGQKVTLQEAQGANARDVTTVTTDAHGNYSFSNLSTNKTIDYAVYCNYQGAQYVSDLISLGTNATQKINLTAYESTNSTAQIAMVLDTILMQQPNAQTGLMTVSEILTFRNIGARTYVGSFDTSKGKPNTLRFSLPANAKNITLSSGFDGYQTAQVDLGFATNAAVPPGTTQFSYSYQIEYNAATYNFRYVVVYPTLQVSVLIPPTLQVDPGFMSPQGVVNSGDHPYRLFESTDLLPGDEIHLTLEGLPTVASTSQVPSLNTNTLWLIAISIVVLAVLAIVGFLYVFNRRKKQTLSKKGSKGKTTSTAMTGTKSAKKEKSSNNTKSSKSNAVPATPKDRQEVLLQELLALDKSYEDRKISKATYTDRRTKTKARLRSLLSEQEASSR